MILENEFFLSTQEFKEKHGQLEEIKGKSPGTTIFKSADKKLVRRIVFPNEDDFRQWLPCLRFEIKKQNDLQSLYLFHVLKIADYTYERIGKEFIFYIAYNCDPEKFKPIFDQLSNFVPNNNEFLIKIVLKILEVGIMIQNSGVCHANIKPSNLLICGDKIRLTDFGSMRTHYRNYQAKYTNEEEINWRKYNQCYRSKEFQEALKSKDIEKFMKKKDNLIQQDIWALGIIILQLFSNNPKQNFDYWKNDIYLIAKINELEFKQFCRPVKDALTQLFNNHPVRAIYDQLFKSQFTTQKKPNNFLKFDKQFNYELKLIYSTDLEEIKDNQTKFIEPPIEPPLESEKMIQNCKIQRQFSVRSELGQYEDDSSNLITEGNQVDNTSVSPSQFDQTKTSFELFQKTKEEIKFQKENQNKLEQPMIQQHQQQINAESSSEAYIADLFEQALITKGPERIEILSKLNLILEKSYDDVILDKYEYPRLGATWELEPIMIPTKGQTQDNKNIPLCYLPYLKLFNYSPPLSTLDVGTLNRKSHGLGSKQTEFGIFQGIFHQGRLLWGTLYEKKENEFIKSTGPFFEEAIHGDECEVIIYNSDLQDKEHYKGCMEKGLKHGKGILVQGNKKIYGTWVKGSLQGQATEVISGQIKQVIFKDNLCLKEKKHDYCKIF